MGVIYSRAEVLQYIWEAVGTISLSQAALGNDKSAALVNAIASEKAIIYAPVDGQVAFELRFNGGANNDINIINVYAMRGDDDHYTPIATLTLNTGLQSGFIDSVGKTNDSWPDNGIEVMNTSDGIARVAMNTYGYKNFLFIAPTLASSDLTIESVRI